ncbi:hydroxymethylglutaryl-CoA synthase [Tichowtungia aerotolerans]|uniref:Hydroxymethylglutaryl-CoA synthase n=1 Tax=Tichowtungia aerotolerans TaxID=2697043 RepID=A0A6P1MBG4_9BACT|nr:hydroxymethylglutaryl-CoA synthase [Tichowtungia aerotolerans]QHI68906.1 hydroxymethylglutaryl-CoA synthase [Tichowtungia aerotolerans]
MKIGIDQISFYTSQYFLDLKTLAKARGVDPDKYRVGIGQSRMGIPPPDEDIVTMAASAAFRLKERGALDGVENLLLATESGIDQSKAAGLFVHGLLGLPSRCRVVELKQACYSATAALRMAMGLVAMKPQSKVLIIASDVARYELDSPGESTQGCGAVAFTISANPRLVAIDPESGFYADDVMDFWRPNYLSEAQVDGKYSTLIYIKALKEAWKQYAEESGRSLDDFARFCYHIPFTRMAAKAHQKLARGISDEELEQVIGESLIYSREAGNCYSASLYVGITSLFDNCAEDLSGRRIGLYSYGSGCVGEFFSGVVQSGYRTALLKEVHQELLAGRTELTFQQYEDIYNYGIPTDGGEHVFAQYCTGPFRFAGIEAHKRIYESV